MPGEKAAFVCLWVRVLCFSVRFCSGRTRADQSTFLKVGMGMWESYQEFWQAALKEMASERWSEYMAHALTEYFGGAATLDGPPGTEAMFRFYEWFLWDYRLPEGHNLFTAILPALQRTLDIPELATWQDAHIWISEVRDITSDPDRVEMVDILSRSIYFAPLWADSLTPGDAFLGRWLLQSDDTYLPTPSLTSIPEELEFILHKCVVQVWHSYEKTSAGYQRDSEEYRRDYGRYFADWLDDLVGPDWRLNTLLYQVYNYREALRKLRRLDGVRQQKDTAVPMHGPIRFHWSLAPGMVVIIHSEELLVAAPVGTDLTAAKLILSYNLDEAVDLLQESEHWPDGQPEALDSDVFSWPRQQDRQVARLLVEHMSSYSRDQIESALRLWHDFTVQEKPRFRKAEVWAAAVELAVRQIDADYPKKHHLESKYGVSASTFTQRYRLLKRTLGLVLGDHRYSTL